MRMRTLGLGTVVAVGLLAMGACKLPPRVVDEAKTGDAPTAFSVRSAGTLDASQDVVIRGSVATQSDFSDYWVLELPAGPHRVKVTCTESAPEALLINRLFSAENDPYTDETPCDGRSAIGGPFTGQFRPHVQFVGAGQGGSYEMTLELLPPE
jgi:hypothetical protein